MGGRRSPPSCGLVGKGNLKLGFLRGPEELLWARKVLTDFTKGFFLLVPLRPCLWKLLLWGVQGQQSPSLRLTLGDLWRLRRM